MSGGGGIVANLKEPDRFAKVFFSRNIFIICKFQRWQARLQKNGGKYYNLSLNWLGAVPGLGGDSPPPPPLVRYKVFSEDEDGDERHLIGLQSKIVDCHKINSSRQQLVSGKGSD